jgi:hypothetical protein
MYFIPLEINKVSMPFGIHTYIKSKHIVLKDRQIGPKYLRSFFACM